jgi:hypothetical protein
MREYQLKKIKSLYRENIKTPIKEVCIFSVTDNVRLNTDYKFIERVILEITNREKVLHFISPYSSKDPSYKTKK